MNFPDSTYEMLYLKATGVVNDMRWVDWAEEMINLGFNSESLYILAGERPPFYAFEMKDLTDAVCRELNININDQQELIGNYIMFLRNQVINDKRKPIEVLRILGGMYNEFNLNRSIQDFALLRWAKEDLLRQEVQWYWKGANRSNIDQIIDDHFLNWSKEKFVLDPE
ncbi:hypothetical protein K6119_09795 [Paracrocinitomix mangrovi]|uniref:hypothetical protein n=1 Tax=Paracrocinitomix mangrovi TaxID=2862509 RepID=UPI001C8E1604|nr:hypothetical protein [Paracrocinitomix mangrovi]UKN03782.1 hypothetical protein K6119_09795 [Paracrocinitomix mangrovi]